MGLFDNSFDIDAYLRKRLMEMDNLKNRELFKEIIVDMMTGLYNHASEEFYLLQERLFKEMPRATRLPDLVTGLSSLAEYDVTDKYMIPMDPEDLNVKSVVTADMLASVKGGEPFYLYTCYIAEDYLELKKLMTEERIFHGIIESEQGQTAADFVLRPNRKYLKQIESLYPVAGLNYLPWRTVNCPYLYKLFDVYVIKIDEWEENETADVKKITVELEEFAEKTYYSVVPLWNMEPKALLGNAYPQPALERGFYEHILYRSQFREDNTYLLRDAKSVIRDIWWSEGDLYILSDEEMPGNWDFYEVHQVPEKAHYTWPLMSNAQNDTFSLNMIEHYGQRIKTKTEIIRYASSFTCAANLTVTRAKIVPYTGVRETYSMEEFMDYEFRSGERNLALEVTFHPQDGSYCLNRDVMSFLMTGLQHFFPEYECIGMLI